MPNVLIPCGGRWVGLVLQLKQAMRQVPMLRRANLFIADRDAMNPAGVFADGTFVVQEVNHPDYLDALLNLCVREDIRLIVPHLDLGLDRLASQVQRFAKAGITIVCPRPDLVELCRNKVLFEQFAKEEKLTYPRSYAPAELQKDLFPLFVKNARGSGSAGAGICWSLHEARAILRQRPDVIFQELVQGTEASIDAYLAASGCCTVRVPRLRLRVIGGEVVQSRTIRDPSLTQLADRTLAALARRGYRGPLNVQIFTGQRPVLIEVNARLGSGIVLTNQATGGRLLRNLLVEACGGVAEGDADDYHEGLHLTRFWGEVFHDGCGQLDVFPPSSRREC